MYSTMNVWPRTVLTLLCPLLLLAVVACTKKPGPAENAGKAIDDATVQAGQKIEKAGENIQDSAKNKKKD